MFYIQRKSIIIFPFISQVVDGNISLCCQNEILKFMVESFLQEEETKESKIVAQ